jgi:hypothetical protein
MDETIFHAGERLVQERTGERGTALINSRSISPGIPAAARNFVGQQRWCVLGAADAAGAMWACLLSGKPGFVQASDDLRSLQVASSDPQGVLACMAPIPDLQPAQSIAVLLIELQTRRRLRINGHVSQASAQALEVEVGQAFPVCPRYIQKRELLPLEAAPAANNSASTDASSGTLLDEATSAWIAGADTLFIASLGPTQDADVSHRGGRPGFVQQQGQVLRIPDFNGNSMFNTLGNLELESRCGLVFPDFEGARQLQLTGHARAYFGVDADIDQTGGTGRWIEFQVDSWRSTPLNLPQRWRLLEASPYNP